MSQSSEATSENSELILLKKLIEIIDGGDQVISLQQDEKSTTTTKQQQQQQTPTTPSLLRTALFGDEQAYFHHKKHQTHSSSSSNHITTLITDDVDFEIVNEGAYNSSTNGFGNDLLNGDLTITAIDETTNVSNEINANDFDDECDVDPNVFDLSKSSCSKWLDESTKLNEDDFQINETEVNQANEREIQILELFKQRYQNEIIDKYVKYYDRIFQLVVCKRISSKSWLTGPSCSNKNIYLVLYAIRILLRNHHYQKQFLKIKNSFHSIGLLLKKYVKMYLENNNHTLIYAHIIDQLLNILNKILFSDTILSGVEQRNPSKASKAASSSSTSSGGAAKQSKLAESVFRSLFENSLHIHLMQLIERSNELCHVHNSFSLLVHICNLSVENRSKLTNDFGITDHLLLILQEYDDDSKKYASRLLSVLCADERIRTEVTNLDGIQILLSLLNFRNNTETIWNVIWCLVQLCSSSENKKEIRITGGIPLILSLLCDSQYDQQQTLTDQTTDLDSSQKKALAELESLQKHKSKMDIQAACCALVGELALDETSSYQIVNSNGVFLVASKLLITRSSNSTTENQSEIEKLERLHRNVWRTLRLLFSAERHRFLIKKIIPFSMLETFVDIGNYKKDLKLYQRLLELFYSLNKEEIEAMRTAIKNCNQTQAPTDYINEYAVYETIGSGAFGRVHKVKKKNSNHFYALKEINTYKLSGFKDKSLGEIVNEVTIIRKNLRHPNIVRYLKTFQEHDTLYIVMELIDGTTLNQQVRALKEKKERWSEEKIWNLFIQIVLALKYLHKEKHIVHRDLTSNNIMLSENDKITITDFGLAKLKENDCSRMISVVGTMFYSCPEIVKNEPYDEKADVWALGCLLYEMCCWEPPFFTHNMLALTKKITDADYDHERLANYAYSPLISQVVKSCLAIDPEKRPDIIGVGSLIPEKLLSYTDVVRSQCIHLEKKLEKEKNRTQK